MMCMNGGVHFNIFFVIEDGIYVVVVQSINYRQK